MKQTVDWHNYWTQNRLGFHEGQVNQYLEKYLDLYNLAEEDLIFMPLCGKAVDIAWLAQQGFRVVGVELSGIAIKDFFRESGMDYESRQEYGFAVYQSHSITLYEGDFMHLQPHHLQDCKLIYDRASLVAIESFNRQAYADKMLEMMPSLPPMLLINLEYDQKQMSGPPFSVEVDEIRQLYHPAYQLEVLTRVEQIDERPRWRDNGLQSLVESALYLQASA